MPSPFYLKIIFLYKTKFHNTMHAMVHTFATSGYTPCAAKNEMTTVLNVVLSANSSRYSTKLRSGFDVLLNVTLRFTRKLNTVETTTAVTLAAAKGIAKTALSS